MGNHFRKLVVSPEVPEQAFHELAVALRSRQNSPITLVVCDLKGKKLRSEHLKQAQEVGLRQIELAGTVPDLVLFEICDSTLGPSKWLYREQDDEQVNTCVPGPEWLEGVFGTTSLAWILDIEEKQIAWNKRSLYAFPSNPPGWDVEVPLNVGLLHVARANESRQCPTCGTKYVSKHDRGQCPQCGCVAMPFTSQQDATRVEEVRLDAYSWGTCARCRAAMQFTDRVQQCQQCGRLLRASSRHALAFRENAEEVEAALARWLDKAGQ